MNRGSATGGGGSRRQEAPPAQQQMTLFEAVAGSFETTKEGAGAPVVKVLTERTAAAGNGQRMPGQVANGRLSGNRVVVNPHLLAARRLARRMGQFPDHSAEQTRAGLTICRQLKAYLKDAPDTPVRH